MMFQKSKHFFLPFLLCFGVLLVSNSYALPFSVKDVCVPLDLGYSIYNGTWIAGSDENALLLLGSEEENIMKVAVASKANDGKYQIVCLSDKVISYQDYLAGSVYLQDKWDDGHPSFWYEFQQSKDIYFSIENVGIDDWRVVYGYITCDEDKVDFSYYTTAEANEIRVYETVSPQICWITEITMSLQGFDLSAVQAECIEALQYLNKFQATHDFGDQDDTYRIIWKEEDM